MYLLAIRIQVPKIFCDKFYVLLLETTILRT